MLRRSAAGVARHQRADGPLRTLPPRTPLRRSRPRGRRLRRRASRHRPRAEVRRAPFAGKAAGRLDAEPVRGIVPERRLPRPGSAASVPAARPGIQPGARPCAAAGLGQPARPPGAAEDPRHADADRASRRTAPTQREGRVYLDVVLVLVRAGAGAPRLRGRPRGRCEHDGRHARGVRESAAGAGCPGSSGGYSGSSRDATALKTSAAISSFERSPSSTIQPPAAAWRR